MSKKIVTTIVTLSVILATVGIIAGINMSKKKKGGMGGFGGFPGGGFGGRPASVTSVRTIVAKKDVLTDFVNTSGEIQTQTSIDVFPSIGGKVVEINVSLGSPVSKGDVIAYIDPSQAGSYYVKSPVVAPIDGSIISSPVKTGQTVNASSVITKIGDINNLQVTAKIPERYVADLEIGEKAQIILQAYPDEVFYASIVRISPVVDAATRTKEIILNFDKNYSKVNAGMYAKVKLFTKDYSGYPAINQDALVNNNDEYFLYVVKEDSSVEKRKVTLGKNIDGYYQILSGINPGEVVVIEGMLTLYEGAKVKDISGNVKALETSQENRKE